MKSIILVLFLILTAAEAKVEAGEEAIKLPILMYHKIGLKKPSDYWVTIEVFEEQMETLKKNGFQTIIFSDLEAFLKGEKTLPKKAVLLTFDDGYQDFYLYAYPVLKKCDFKATVFLITEMVAESDGQRMSSNWNDSDKETISLHLIWPEIREMAKYGIEFGGHSHTHPDLTDGKLIERDLEREIFLNKEIIEKKLGKKIIVFAYPGGRNNEKIQGLVKKAGYKFAVISGGGIEEDIKNSHLFTLRRLPVFDQDALSLLSQSITQE